MRLDLETLLKDMRAAADSTSDHECFRVLLLAVDEIDRLELKVVDAQHGIELADSRIVGLRQEIKELEQEVEATDKQLKYVAAAGAKLFDDAGPHDATLPECIEHLVALPEKYRELEADKERLEDAIGCEIVDGDSEAKEGSDAN